MRKSRVTGAAKRRFADRNWPDERPGVEMMNLPRETAGCNLCSRRRRNANRQCWNRNERIIFFDRVKNCAGIEK